MSNWTNPYLAKIDSFPGFLLIGNKGAPTEEELTLIRDKALQFERLFIEPCSGSGGHLIEVAKAHPKALCIGIEQRYKRAFRTVEKALRDGISNVMTFRGDVRAFLKALPSQAVDTLYLNFPDPWERAKWEKHRIISKALFDELARILKPSGIFKYKTDHQISFKSTVNLLSDDKRFVITKSTENATIEESRFLSEFEMLFRSKNMPVYLLECTHKHQALT